MAPALEGRLVIIAGGIGGLGSSIAHRLHAHGASVALLYAPFERDRVVDTLKRVFGAEEPERVWTFECDITSEASVKMVFGQDGMLGDSSTVEAFPSILINAAGYVSVQPLEETSSEEAMKNILPNLLGPLNCSTAFFHLYQSRASQLNRTPPPGRIVSIASQAAHVALDGHGAYCASKAGLLGLTRCMASEWGPKGITANTVSPTVTWTPLAAKAWADEDKKAKHLSEIPTGRFAVPEEVASAIEFLCGDESGMINGADVRVDGGFTIR
ncbi:uncharacterized protein Z520_11486 [Fonsecaea multimorphosa CBS 102226]|uniref:Uncharacterized protein n=1 Tax=Fonsecaea multimorphosa CBS 102226 TaxID=1442371 RepID=A0A0D2K900_9EURO|nr:uncharacterized protein Z520_11486 [Fonsecaea multimorphosa CBS 102226]KIX92823.1 hypothetical protein Z520_11486 [Fonsecaea multimorphosa CBS 102226]OAL18071.1 hypothetical protein AYO22_10993 [Fonsecaea multimorphosa]